MKFFMLNCNCSACWVAKIVLLACVIKWITIFQGGEGVEK